MARTRKTSIKKVSKKKLEEKEEIGQMMRTQILLTVELLSNFLVVYDDYKKPIEDDTLKKLGVQLLNLSEAIQSKMSEASKEAISNRVDFIYNCWMDLGFVQVKDEQKIMDFIKQTLNIKNIKQTLNIKNQ